MSAGAGKRKRTSTSKAASSPPTKKAKWTSEQAKIVTEQINKGESVASLQKLFPDYTTTQIHSKVSNLKKQGAIKKIASTGLAPSMKEADDNLFELLEKDEDLDSEEEEKEDSVESGDDAEIGNLVKKYSTKPSTLVKKKQPSTPPRKVVSPTEVALPPTSGAVSFGESSQTPVAYWQYEKGKKWILILKKGDGLSFLVKPEKEQISIRWTLEAPTHLATELGLQRGSALLGSLNGTQIIVPPRAIETHSQLVTRVDKPDYRVLIFSFYEEAADVYF